jgi:hypothetical protein
VFSGHGAEYMWLMCIPPLVGWFGLAWIICTHERVTCFNYKKLLAWVDVNGEARSRQDALEVDCNVGAAGSGDVSEGDVSYVSVPDYPDGSVGSKTKNERAAEQRRATQKLRPRTASLERNLDKARGFAAKREEKDQKKSASQEKRGSAGSSTMPSYYSKSREKHADGYEKLGTEEEP